MPHLEVNGARLHYEDTGAGDETIVFAHGLLWSGAMYRFQVDALRDRYRCVTFDFRGQGRSEVTRAGYDMETLADDAAALVERLGCAPCHFVGLSMGGFVGLRLAIRRPELLRSLVLLESAADAEPLHNRPRYAAMALVARFVGVAPLAEPVMRIMFGRAFLDDPARRELRDQMRRELLAVDRRGAMRATLGVIGRRSVEDRLGAIRVPTLVASGEADTAVVAARSRRTAERIPGARFVTLPRAGHTSSIEEPERVTETIARFLDDVRAKAVAAR